TRARPRWSRSSSVPVALKFRHRIGLLVVLVATALVTVTAVALVLGRRGEQQLAGIETLYVPLIELDRDLKNQFAEIPRALETATTPDRSRLTAAFATARASQRDSIWIDFAVATSALVLIGLLSWRIIRDTVHALRSVADGVERLARGDFTHEIAVTTHDEL